MINLGLCDLDQIYVLNKSVGLFRTITITNWVHCPPSRQVTTRTKMHLNTRCCTFFSLLACASAIAAELRISIHHIHSVTPVYRATLRDTFSLHGTTASCMAFPASRSQANFSFCLYLFQYCTQLNRLSSPFDHRACRLSNHSESTGLASS